MATNALTIGVHPAGLARAQAERVARSITASGVPFSVHLEIIAESESTPRGLHDDHIAENRSEIRRLHRLLREGEIDVVIHRGFDLRGDVPDDLRIGAVLERGNPFDVLIGTGESGLDELDEDAHVGVVQLRSRAQLIDYRPDLHYELVTGDAGDWLTALIDEDVEALVAPGAAIEHLGLQERVSEIFPPELLVPAPGSGILLCLCRPDDRETVQRLRGLHDTRAAVEYTAECSFMESMGGPWEAAIGALARLADERIEISAVVASADGAQVLRERHLTGDDDPCLAGAELAALMIHAGADQLLEAPLDEEVVPCTIAGHLPVGDTEIDWEDDPEEDPDDDPEAF